jgi:hypothetical protein
VSNNTQGIENRKRIIMNEDTYYYTVFYFKLQQLIFHSGVTKIEMFQDEDLDHLTVNELQELSVLFPIRQLVQHLNRRALQRKTIGSRFNNNN